MVGLGKGLHDIASHLSEKYGERYYVTKLDKPEHITFTLWRANKLAPYTAHEIYSLNAGNT